MTVGEFGQQGAYDGATDYAATSFIVKQAIGKVRTGVLVQVLAVHGGGVGPAPTVDVQPIVNLTDGIGTASQHGKIFGVPVGRMQGGLNALIIDPQVNDIGLLVVNDRDISAAKANNGAVSNPGSFRRHSFSDGVFVGVFLMPGSPNQYLTFTTTGAKLVDKNGNIIEMKSGEIDITATKVTINGNLAVTGAITAAGEITAGSGGGDSVGLQTHKHPTAPTGPVSPPTPGT